MKKVTEGLADTYQLQVAQIRFVEGHSIPEFVILNPREKARSIFIMQTNCEGETLNEVQLDYNSDAFVDPQVLIDMEAPNLYLFYLTLLPKGQNVLFCEVFPIQVNSVDEHGFRTISLQPEEAKKRIRTQPKRQECVCELVESIPEESSNSNVCLCQRIHMQPSFVRINQTNGVIVGLCARITKKKQFCHRLTVYELNDEEKLLIEHSTNYLPMNRYPFDGYFVKNGSQLLVSFNSDFESHVPDFLSMEPELDYGAAFVLFDFSNSMFSPQISNIYVPEFNKWGPCLKPKSWPFCKTFSVSGKEILTCIATSTTTGRLYKYSIFVAIGKNKSTSEIINAEGNYKFLVVKNLAKSIINEKAPKDRPIIFSKCSDLFTDFDCRISELAEKERKGVVFRCYNRCEFWGNEFFSIHLLNTIRKRRENKLFKTVRLHVLDTFKDYRTCANCMRSEKHKRQNINGKRIANFKVCKICKRNNIHLRWKEFPCHFCSIKCLKAGWKKHEEQLHKLKPLKR